MNQRIVKRHLLALWEIFIWIPFILMGGCTTTQAHWGDWQSDFSWIRGERTVLWPNLLPINVRIEVNEEEKWFSLKQLI